MDYATAKQHYATVGKTFKSSIGLYRDVRVAKSAALMGAKPQRVVLGEDGYVVVCLPRPAENLVKAGYQYA